MNLNKVQLIGVLTDTPTVAGGVTTFHLATPDVHRVVARHNLGKVVAKYLQRGSRVFVEGRLEARSTPSSAEVVAENLILLGHRTPATLSACCHAPMVNGGAQCEACGSGGELEPPQP